MHSLCRGAVGNAAQEDQRLLHSNRSVRVTREVVEEILRGGPARSCYKEQIRLQEHGAEAKSQIDARNKHVKTAMSLPDGRI